MIITVPIIIKVTITRRMMIIVIVVITFLISCKSDFCF